MSAVHNNWTPSPHNIFEEFSRRDVRGNWKSAFYVKQDSPGDNGEECSEGADLGPKLIINTHKDETTRTAVV